MILTKFHLNAVNVTDDTIRNLIHLPYTDSTPPEGRLRTGSGTRIGKQYRPDSEQNWTVNTRYVYGAYGEILAQYAVSGPLALNYQSNMLI